MYPANWPRCPKCDDFALDGHITCGRFECAEYAARRERARERGPFYERTSTEGGLGKWTVHEWPGPGEAW